MCSFLKKKNKFHLTASFDAIYASAKKKVENASEINRFFKELNIQEMMTSQSVEEFSQILSGILQNLKRIVNIEYDVKRIYQLI